MGYALFTARKLMLQTRLNQMNYRLMILSQQQQDMTQQTAGIQMMNSFRASQNSIFAYNEYDKAKAALSTGTMIKDGQSVPVDQAYIDTKTKDLQDTLNHQLNDLQLQSKEDTLRLQTTATVGNQIDLEMKKLDSQIKETTAEMESVEKAEEQAIKASAPKYGGGAG